MEKLQLVENINKTLAVIFGDRYKVSVTDTAVQINDATIKEYKSPVSPLDITGAVSEWACKEFSKFRILIARMNKIAYIEAVTSTECRINEDVMMNLSNPIHKGGER